MRTALPLLLLSLAGCAAGDGTLAEVDPGALPERPTWSSHARQILDVYCNGCHSDDAIAGAAEGFAYDTCRDAKKEQDETYEVTFDELTMPPPAGFPMPTAARDTLQRWYDQGAPCD